MVNKGLMDVNVRIATLLLSLFVAGSLPAAAAAAPSVKVLLPGHIPTQALSHSRLLGRADSQESVRLVFALPLRNQDVLDDLLRRISDPSDALYRHFLTSAQFTSLFGPSQADYDAVASFAASQGLSVTGRHANRLLLDVEAKTSRVESAFGVHLIHYQSAEGRHFHAPDQEPSIPTALSGRLAAVVGLENAAQWHGHVRRQQLASPFQTGSGPGGGLTPANIRTAYNLSGVSATGSGQTLAVFELDGYHSTDIATYEGYFGLPSVPLQNVLVDGVSGAAGSGADEVTLDIELMVALAPGAGRILVYEGPNSNAGVLDTYNRIATDNVAKQISTSWGLAENLSGSAMLSSENTIFKQMAAQGQSIYAASGDSGAYDDGSTLSVDDPASQPYVTGVGGTHLTLASGGAYGSETTWNSGSVNAGASGGGVSQMWAIPSYQQGTIPSASKGSTTMRNVPDVSLDADPSTGYSIYVGGAWWVFGGTSCAAPLWAAFTARVNQQRAVSGSGPLGFANPALYQLGAGSSSATDFHDVADGSTNLYYPAVAGHDDATGWGSFNGAALLSALAPGAGTTTSPPPAPTGLTAKAGNAQVYLAWNASSGATSYNVKRSTTSGSGYVTVKSGVTTTGYTDGSLTNGVTYYYVVTAVNSAGESATSNQASATPTASSTTAPAAPLGLTASAGDTKVGLSWQASTGATGYNVKRSTSSGGPYTTVASAIASTGYTVTGLTDGTTYFFVVSAVNSGGESPNSVQVSAKPTIAAPTGLSAYAVSTSQINLYWTNQSTSATSILVEIATYYYGWTYIGSIPATSTACAVVNLSPYTTYYFRIRATNGASTSAYSNSASATTYW